MPLTPMQKDVLRQLFAGRKMVHYGYTPGVHLPAHTCWADEESNFWSRKNYNITMRALHEKGLIDLVHTGVCREMEVKLTVAGQEVARGL